MYFKTFPLEDSLQPAELANGKHAVEYRFELDLGIPHPDIEGRNIYFVGLLDFLGERKVGNEVKRYILDEKTTKNIFRIQGTKEIDTIKESKKYLASKQFLGYHYAARALGVETHGTIIRKVPIMSKYEPAFELHLPVTDFAIDTWYRTTRLRILYLLDKYISYKAKGDIKYPHTFFSPVYDDRCMNYSKPCIYMDGCVLPEGEDILKASFPQQVCDSSTKHIPVALEEYLERIDKNK